LLLVNAVYAVARWRYQLLPLPTRKLLQASPSAGTFVVVAPFGPKNRATRAPVAGSFHRKVETKSGRCARIAATDAAKKQLPAFTCFTCAAVADSGSSLA
jgi:hypothetical protein